MYMNDKEVFIPDISKESYVDGLNQIISSILIWIFSIYFLVASVIFIPYYNWQFIKQNSFISWILLGGIVPTFKAFTFPYFLIRDLNTHISANVNLSSEQNSALKDFYLALEISQRGTQVGNSKLGLVGNDEFEKELNYYKQSVSLGSSISKDILNTVYPDLGTNFENKFIAGSSLYIEGANNKDSQKINSGIDMRNDFIDWLNKNRYSIPRVEN